MSTDLGRNIQYLRLQSKESQEVMAQKLNISRQAISKWENNVSVPDVAMLSKIANYYDVEITYFTSDENSNMIQYYESKKSSKSRQMTFNICSLSFMNKFCSQQKSLTNPN